MRKFFLSLMLWLSPFAANAGTYVLVCQSSCIAGDGTTQPKGTVLQKIIWDGATPYKPSGFDVVLYTNQTIYLPSTPAPVSVPVAQFFSRFTTAEFNALMANSVAAGVIARLNAYGANSPIYVSDPIIVGYMQQAVTGAFITSGRRDTILNLSVPSP